MYTQKLGKLEHNVDKSLHYLNKIHHVFVCTATASAFTNMLLLIVCQLPSNMVPDTKVGGSF